MQDQRKLLEAEKEYKTGLNTLKDLIAPSALRINQNSIEVSGKLPGLSLCLFLPTIISVNWLAPSW